MIKEFFENLKNRKFKTSITTKGLHTIQQTERNVLKQDFMDILQKMLNNSIETQELNADTFRVADGIAVTCFNEELDQEVVFLINPTIPALASNGVPYDIYLEQENYLKEQADKKAEKEKKIKAKQKKIDTDNKLRAKAKAEKEKAQ